MQQLSLISHRGKEEEEEEAVGHAHPDPVLIRLEVEGLHCHLREALVGSGIRGLGH